MNVSRKGLLRWLDVVFKVPVWMYQARLGRVFGRVFFGRVIAIVHRGSRSGNRYMSGREALERHESHHER